MARCKMYPLEKDSYHGFEDKQQFFKMVAEIKKILNYSQELKKYSLLSSGANVSPKFSR